MEDRQYKFTGDDTRDLELFEDIYKRYYSYLCLLSEYIVKDASDAEEVVSDVFLKFWRLRLNIEKSASIKAYLCRAVRNTSLNYAIKNNKINKLTVSTDYELSEILNINCPNTLDEIYSHETSEIIKKGIDTLPDACKKIFLLSRDQNMSYIEIAEQLSISVNTVKTQIKIALSKLREYIKNHQ
jgi:RNA polymerase sigma-70 factor (ECF subfamily)